MTGPALQPAPPAETPRAQGGLGSPSLPYTITGPPRASHGVREGNQVSMETGSPSQDMGERWREGQATSCLFRGLVVKSPPPARRRPLQAQARLRP